MVDRSRRKSPAISSALMPSSVYHMRAKRISSEESFLYGARAEAGLRPRFMVLPRGIFLGLGNTGAQTGLDATRRARTSSVESRCVLNTRGALGPDQRCKHDRT